MKSVYGMYMYIVPRLHQFWLLWFRLLLLLLLLLLLQEWTLLPLGALSVQLSQQIIPRLHLRLSSATTVYTRVAGWDSILGSVPDVLIQLIKCNPAL